MEKRYSYVLSLIAVPSTEIGRFSNCPHQSSAALTGNLYLKESLKEPNETEILLGESLRQKPALFLSFSKVIFPNSFQNLHFLQLSSAIFNPFKMSLESIRIINRLDEKYKDKISILLVLNRIFKSILDKEAISGILFVNE